MTEYSKEIFILYSPDIDWDWSSSVYPTHDNPAFVWSSNFIPVKENNSGVLEVYHMWMKLKIGENDSWTNPMRITNPQFAKGETGAKGDAGDTGLQGLQGSDGKEIQVEYADASKNLVSGTSNAVVFVRFKKDPYNTSSWFRIVGIDNIDVSIFGVGVSGQVFSNNGVSGLWINKTDIYNDTDARIAVIDDSLLTSTDQSYSIDKIIALTNAAATATHDDRYYTEVEMDAFLLIKEPAFTKNTGFNKNFGVIAGTVSEGNHTHNEFGNYYTKLELDSGQLDNRYYTETEIGNILQDYYTIAQLNAGQLDNRYFTETEIVTLFQDYYTIVQLDAGQLDNRYFTETEIIQAFTDYYTKIQLDAGQLDNRYYTETELSVSNPATVSVHWDNIKNKPASVATVPNLTLIKTNATGVLEQKELTYKSMFIGDGSNLPVEVAMPVSARILGTNSVGAPVTSVAVLYYDATVGSAGEYPTINAAVTAGKYVLKQVGTITELSNTNISSIKLYGDGNLINLGSKTLMINSGGYFTNCRFIMSFSSGTLDLATNTNVSILNRGTKPVLIENSYISVSSTVGSVSSCFLGTDFEASPDYNLNTLIEINNSTVIVSNANSYILGINGYQSYARNKGKLINNYIYLGGTNVKSLPLYSVNGGDYINFILDGNYFVGSASTLLDRTKIPNLEFKNNIFDLSVPLAILIDTTEGTFDIKDSTLNGGLFIDNASSTTSKINISNCKIYDTDDSTGLHIQGNYQIINIIECIINTKIYFPPDGGYFNIDNCKLNSSVNKVIEIIGGIGNISNCIIGNTSGGSKYIHFSPSNGTVHDCITEATVSIASGGVAHNNLLF
jgi:hypothetical protein